MSIAATTMSSDVTALGAAELARRIAAGDVSSAEVIEAHLARIVEVNSRLNALTQPLFEEARQAAAAADEARAAGLPLPPLHGVPITVKDCFDLRGTYVTLGIPHLNHSASSDSPLVARLRSAGAVILGKTNVPQTLLMHECDNPRFGRTLHPLDAERSPGGSTGGEAALIAARGSPLGLGSDMGGSIRQPAHSCGLCGFKPTTGRLTLAGHYRPLPGMKAIATQPGPLARHVEDIELAMRVLMDHRAVPRQSDERGGPWTDPSQVALERLRIGYWCQDGVVDTAPAVARAVGEAAAALASLGAEVVRLEAPDMREVMRLYFGLISADGLRCVKRLVKGSRVNWQFRRQITLGALPRALRPPLAGLLRAVGQKNLAAMLSWSGARSTDDYWQLTAATDQYRGAFWPNLFKQAGGHLDAVLLPPHALPALRHGTALDLLLAAGGCFLPNLLDAPAGVVPWTVTHTDEQEYPRSIDHVERVARRTIAGSAGLPVGVQVMAPAWRDDVVLTLMRELESTTPRPTT